MKAFVLCGGKGTRLRPYTDKMPKPMLPIQGKPILQHILEHLKAGGITDITLFVGYMRQDIRDYFGDGKKFGLKISYVEEEEERGTAGAILHAKRPAETFLVTMGDHLTDISIKEMLALHKKSGCTATIAVMDHHTKIEYGVIRTRRDGKVDEFQEKPVLMHKINTGIYIMEPEIFNYIKEKEDFAKNVFPRLLSSGKCIGTYTLTGYWRDIGNVEEYETIKGTGKC
ncbi:MAG: nucleotidyltransferase family protein [Candidatus Micrarchaeia archaeon]|jgi:mannose-1-phosphate guanylyltransferase/phosphomannomutase